MRLYVALFGVLAVSGLAATPALADKAAYCQAYARDFSDARATDKTEWQHKYDIALDACLGGGKKPVAPKAAEVAKPAPTKPPVVAAAAVQPQVAKPAPDAPVKPIAEADLPDLVVGTPAWNDYCAKKYTSFNVKTGMYLSHTGVSRHCLVTKDFKG
jgi:hypothetical protein